jgi:hypothetical protein
VIVAEGEHELTEREAAVLLAATKDALAKAGAMGGSLGAPLGSFGAERAGAAGGRFGARFTRPRTAAAVLEVREDVEVVRERARRAIAEHGALIDDPNGAGDGAVWGVVRSGALDMAPALVRVAVEAGPGGGARAHVRATGREGLIKQRIGGKAVDRLRTAIEGGAP